jgi:hypothetical protein
VRVDDGQRAPMRRFDDAAAGGFDHNGIHARVRSGG